MAVWKLQRLARVSSLSGEPFPPDAEVVTALFGEDEEVGEDRVRGSGFVRKDFLATEVDEATLAGAFCVWRTRTPPAREEGPRRFDLELAREFLERLLEEGREDRAPVCLTLALLLARKRRLVIVDQDARVLRVRWPRDTALFEVPAPPVSEAEAEQLQQELMRLFEVDGGAGEPAPGGEDADGAAPGGGEVVADGAQAPDEAAPGAAADADPLAP